MTFEFKIIITIIVCLYLIYCTKLVKEYYNMNRYGAEEDKIKMNNDLCFEVIEKKVRAMNGREFEEFAAYLMANIGYRVELTQATRDGGKDIIVNKDIYVECKCYKEGSLIGEEIVKKLYASCAADNIQKAIIITTSNFTKTAIELINTYYKKGVTIQTMYLDDIFQMCTLVGTRKVLYHLGLGVDAINYLVA